MGRRIVWIVVLVAVLIGGFVLLKRHKDAQEVANGDVHCDGCMTPEEHARFLKENAGETADGESDHKNKTAREEAATDFEDVTTANGGPAGASGGAGTPSRPSGRSAGMQPQQPDFTVGNSASPASEDTLPPHVPNGARVAGSGTYQWYRQGNITWRIDTATGRSCIIYATMEEWRKSIVMSHGCGRNA